MYKYYRLTWVCGVFKGKTDMEMSSQTLYENTRSCGSVAMLGLMNRWNGFNVLSQKEVDAVHVYVYVPPNYSKDVNVHG